MLWWKFLEYLMKLLRSNMDEEIFEIAKDNDLSLEEAKELQEFSEENDLDPNDALEIWQDL